MIARLDNRAESIIPMAKSIGTSDFTVTVSSQTLLTILAAVVITILLQNVNYRHLLDICTPIGAVARRLAHWLLYLTGAHRRVAVMFARWCPHHYLDGALYWGSSQGTMPLVMSALIYADPGNHWVVTDVQRSSVVHQYLIDDCPMGILSSFPIALLPLSCQSGFPTTRFVLQAGRQCRVVPIPSDPVDFEPVSEDELAGPFGQRVSDPLRFAADSPDQKFADSSLEHEAEYRLMFKEWEQTADVSGDYTLPPM
jgi:hypothetical protein